MALAASACCGAGLARQRLLPARPCQADRPALPISRAPSTMALALGGSSAPARGVGARLRPASVLPLPLLGGRRCVAARAATNGGRSYVETGPGIPPPPTPPPPPPDPSIGAKKGFWTFVDVAAILGSVGGALAAILNLFSGTPILFLPLVLPVISLVAALQREGLIAEVGCGTASPRPRAVLGRVRNSNGAGGSRPSRAPPLTCIAWFTAGSCGWPALHHGLHGIWSRAARRGRNPLLARARGLGQAVASEALWACACIHACTVMQVAHIACGTLVQCLSRPFNTCACLQPPLPSLCTPKSPH